MADTHWTCVYCRAEHTDDAPFCPTCTASRYAPWDIQVSEHVLEHLAEFADQPERGATLSLDVQKAMNARPCYANLNHGQGFALQFIASRIRLLTSDSRALARKLFDAHAAKMALNVIHHGDTKDHIAALKGRQVLGDVVEHHGEVVHTLNVNAHPGPPPKP